MNMAGFVRLVAEENKSDMGRSSGQLARADSTELRFVSHRHTLGVVTPTPAAYGRDNPMAAGAMPREIIGAEGLGGNA